MYVPVQCKTQQICDKVILENGGTLKCVSYCYKNQEICIRAVENYPHALEFVPECYKLKEYVIKLSILTPILLQ